MCVPIRGRTSHWLFLVRPALKLNLSHAAFHTSAARTKPLGVRLVKDDCGSVAATPLISGDIVDGPTFVSPSAAAAAAAAVFAAPFIASIQPWEMTASCLSLLAAAAAHYPHLVRASNVYCCPIPSLIAAVIVIHNSAGVEASARGLAMCRFDGTGCGSLTRLSAANNCSTRQLFFSLIAARLTIRVLRGAAGTVAVRQPRYHWCPPQIVC